MKSYSAGKVPQRDLRPSCASRLPAGQPAPARRCAMIATPSARANPGTRTKTNTTERRLPYTFDAPPKILHDLIRQKVLKGRDQAVLVELLRWRNQYQNSCWVTKDIIARNLQCSDRTVQRPSADSRTPDSSGQPWSPRPDIPIPMTRATAPDGASTSRGSIPTHPLSGRPPIGVPTTGAESRSTPDGRRPFCLPLPRHFCLPRGRQK